MKKNILIVEDDQDIQYYFKLTLVDPDYDLVQVENGAEALAVIDSGKNIDLIVLDMVMPVMDGEEFFRILRVERKLDIPVIFCSVDESRAEPLKKVGMLNGVFLKGRESRELKDLIGRNL